MEDQNKRIVEINGVKIEVDLRTAKTVSEYRVGDKVKVLVKDYSSYKSHFGTIVGFDDFKNLPTIIVAYIDKTYSGAPLHFVYLNSENKDVELCPCNETDIGFDKSDIIDNFDKELSRKELEIKELKTKKEYFLKMFGRYFVDFKD